MSHPHPKRSFVLQAVLTRSGKLRTASAAVNTVRPVNTANTKAVNTANTKAVNTARQVNTVGSKQTVNHPRPINNTFKRGYSQRTNADQESLSIHGWKAKNSSASTIFKKFPTLMHEADPRNKCYLDEYEDYDGGLVSFSDVKGRISGKERKATQAILKGTKLRELISKPLHILHMDLFGPTNVKSLMKRSYCLVVTNDFSRFSWVFFLATKDETSGILKTFITKIENQLDHKVKVIRSDNGTEFKNSIMNQFCEIKGTKRELSVARTPQQNRVAERKNRKLIEAARTMLVDSKLPTTFWAEAVNTDCYVLNRSLIIKASNKTLRNIFKKTLRTDRFHGNLLVSCYIVNTKDHLASF
ncbi:putative ribonuclease H-like domain-containing protein [Tanacetum coccineum]